MPLCIILFLSDLEGIIHVKNIYKKKNLLHSIKISSSKKIKDPRLIKIMREPKRKLNAIEKGKIIKTNELEEDLRIETVKRRIKEKSVSFKMKKKEKEK